MIKPLNRVPTRLVIVCALSALGLLCACFYYFSGRGAPEDAPPGGKPAYQRLFRESFERVLANCPPPKPEAVHDRNLREFITLAYCARRAFQLSRDEKHLQLTRQYFQAVLRAWENEPPLMEKHLNPFFVLELFFQVERFLASQRMLDSRDRATIRRYIDHIGPPIDKEDNRTLAFAAGLAHLMKRHPEHPHYQKWRAAVEKAWGLWYAYKQNIENATTYTAIGWNAVFSIARNQDRVAQLKDEEVRRIFAQYQRMVTPAGALPNYGDSYFGKSWTYWVLLLENAARHYQDDHLAATAERVFWWGVHNQPVTSDDDEERNFAELVRLKPLADLIGWPRSAPPDSTAAPPPGADACGGVSYRAVAPARTRPDKMILTAGREHFALVDMFATGFHAHHNRRGAILYYESGGNPLFHSLDRHNKSLEDANSFVVMPLEHRDTYPCNHLQEKSQWTTERVPLGLLADKLNGEAADGEVEIDRIVLRFSAKQANDGILFDNLRLIGPAGPRRLDADGKFWKGDFDIRAKEDAASCLAIGGDVGVTFISTVKDFHAKIDLDRYTHLAYDWKDLSPEQRNRFLLRVYTDHRLTHFDMDARNHHAYPGIVSVAAEQKEGAAHGTIELKHYKARGSRLIRHIALLKTGVLMIKDRFYLPTGAAPHLAGPVWNYHQDDVEQHGHWFINERPPRIWRRADERGAANNPARLLVWFPPRQGRTGKLQRRLHHGSTTTAFWQTVAQPGKWTTTYCAVYPLGDGGPSPQDAADWLESHVPRSF